MTTHDRLKAALTAAMKARDATATAALRSALAAIDNAEAVGAAPSSPLVDGPIAGAVIGLSRSLGAKSLAEGVETDAQLATLAELGCDLAQGYLFGRPVRAAEVTRAMCELPRRESRLAASAVGDGL